MHTGQLRELTHELLRECFLYTPAAEHQVIGTVAHESKMGHYIRQVKGPALGIGQIEPLTHDSIWKYFLSRRVYHPWYEKFERYIAGPERPPDPRQLVWNHAYSILMVRIFYLRIPEALPAYGNIPGYARYWKRYYNTHVGRGTEEQFIEAWKEFGL